MKLRLQRQTEPRLKGRRGEAGFRGSRGTPSGSQEGVLPAQLGQCAARRCDGEPGPAKTGYFNYVWQVLHLNWPTCSFLIQCTESKGSVSILSVKMQLEVCYSSDYEGTPRYSCNLKFTANLFIFLWGLCTSVNLVFLCVFCRLVFFHSSIELKVGFVVPLWLEFKLNPRIVFFTVHTVFFNF